MDAILIYGKNPRLGIRIVAACTLQRSFSCFFKTRAWFYGIIKLTYCLLYLHLPIGIHFYGRIESNRLTATIKVAANFKTLLFYPYLHKANISDDQDNNVIKLTTSRVYYRRSKPKQEYCKKKLHSVLTLRPTGILVGVRETFTFPFCVSLKCAKYFLGKVVTFLHSAALDLNWLLTKFLLWVGFLICLQGHLHI